MTREAHPARVRCTDRGFTLIEVGLVLLVIAMFMGVAVPTIQSVTGARARGEVGKLAANIRATRGEAALSGRTCRIVFDLDANGYAVECAEGTVRASRERAFGGARDAEEEEQDPDKLSESEKMRRQILKRASFASSRVVKPVSFEGGLEYESVWTSHQEEKYSKGKAYLYFFPSGLGERANIQLRQGDSFYTLQVSPLDGHVKILPDRVDMRDQDDED